MELKSNIVVVLILFLTVFITCFIRKSDGETLPSLLWDSRNPLFGCANLTIKAKIRDTLYLVHQREQINPLLLEKNLQKKFNKIYRLTSRETYDTCNITGANSEVIELQTYDHNTLPYGRVFLIETGVNVVKYERGKTYYFVGIPEDASKISANGSCTPKGGLFPLKFILEVCSDDEDCDVCETTSCYERVSNCGWGSWKKQNQYVWNGTNCLQKYNRDCDTNYFTCNGNANMYEVTKDDKCDKNEYCPSSSTVYPSIASSPTSMHCPTQTVSKTVILENTKSCLTATSISIQPTAVVSIITSTISVTNTVTTTKTEKETVTETVGSCTVTPSKPSTQPPEVSYEMFYITVVAAVLGAILIGIFVSHACVSYFKEKRTKTKIIEVEEYRPPSEMDTGSTSKAEPITYPNGTYTPIG